MAKEQKKQSNRDDAPATMGESAVQIVDAETDIKEMAKAAVLKNEPKAIYLRRVGAMLKKRLVRVRSPTLVQKALESLPRFAAQTYDREAMLLRLYADIFKIALDANSKGAPNGAELLKNTLSFLGDTTEKIGFKVQLINNPNVPQQLPNVITGTGYAPELRSDQMHDAGIDAAIYETALPLEQLHSEYMKAVDRVRKELIDSHAADNYSGNVSLRNIAEMTVRYENQLKMIDGLRDSGENLVYIEPHANCSPRCEPYQVGGSKHPSGLYSLDGTSGKTPDGVPFKPLEFATNNPADQYTTMDGKVYQNGCILGYNCRHKLIPYRPGNKPMPIPARVIKQQREWELTQRAMEREIRMLKEKEIQATTEEARKKIQDAVKKKYSNYKKFSREKNIAYYPIRTEINING